MTHQPRTLNEIKDDLQSSLEGKIPGITNFADSSFNETWIDAYAREIRALEVKVVAAQLALWVDYAGNSNLTQTDLERTGISFSGWSTSEIDSFVSDINGLMEDVHLDRIGDLVGIDRGTGTEATGTVTITTQSDTTEVPEGLEVATQPDASGDYVSFFVDADDDGDVTGDETVTPDPGQTTVDVSVIASDVGTEYNVGANTITFFPSGEPGIEAVNNSSETSGGEDEQSNDSYRNDLKGAIITESGGGTAGGIEGAIEGISGVNDAALDEFQDDDPPHVDVIADGGSDSDITDEIDVVKPTGIRHDLVRPENLNVGYRTTVVGTDIDTTFTTDQADSYITDLALGEAFRRSKLVQRLMNADMNIDDIAVLCTPLTSVENESHEFQNGTNKYELNFAPLGDIQGEKHFFQSGTDKYVLDYNNVDDTVASSITAIVDGNETDLAEGTDYNLIDDTNDTGVDTIDFSAGGDSPDDRTVFEIEYELNDAAVNANTVTGTLSGSDNTFTEGTDYNLIDDNSDDHLDTIDWSIGGDDPDDGTLFFVDYDPKRIILNDHTPSIREKVSLDGAKTSLSTINPA